MSQTQQFTDTLSGYANQFPHILSDYKQAYINASGAPDNQGYSNTYDYAKQNIRLANSQLFMLQSKVQLETDTLNDEVVNLDSKIDTAKELQAKLKKELADILAGDSGADILNSEMTELYTTQYISNVSMILGILVLGYSLFSIYRKG
jgi:hypothetical protein